MSILKTGKFYVPQPSASATAWGAFATAISGVNDAVSYVFQAPMTGTIDSFKFWEHAQTTGGTIDARIETVDGSTGNPSGSLKGTNTNASVTLAGAATENTATLTAGCSVTKGDVIAIKLLNPGSSAPNYSVKTSGELLAVEFPYCVRLVSGVSTKSASDLAVALHYSDGGGQYVEINSGRPVSAAAAPSTTAAFSSASNPNRYGNKFVAPAALNVTGAWLRATPTTTSDFIIELYDGANNVVASYTHDSTEVQGGLAIFFFEFTTSVVLVPGATYRITLRPTTANTLSMDYVSLANSAYMAAASGGGIFSRTTSGNGTSWSDTATDQIYIGLICDGIQTYDGNEAYF